MRKLKKFLACTLAILCTATSLGVGSNVIDTKMYTSRSFNRNGVVYADSSYPYYDNGYYTHAISSVSLKLTDEDTGTKVDVSQWVDDGYTYGIFKIAVSHKEGTKTVKDSTTYRVGMVSCDADKLLVNCGNNVKIPDSTYQAFNETYNNGDETVIIEDSDICTVIGGNALKNCNVKTLDLENVKYIGDSAFSKCLYITTVDVPECVLYMGDGVFSDSGLKTLTLNNTMTKIPDKFCKNTQLSSFTVTNSSVVYEIGESAFENTVMNKCWFSDNEAYLNIGDNAYKNCTLIKNVVLPDNVSIVGASAFEGCTALQSVAFGANVYGVDKKAFYGCTSLTSVTFNDVLSTLGGAVFANCTSLVKIEGLPESLHDWIAVTANTGTGFGNNMFGNCTSLKSVELPDSLTKIPEGLFKGCTSLTDVVVGDNINAIGKEAFYECKNLLNVETSNVSRIEEKAFYKCTSIKTVDSMICTEVGESAFEGCTSLQSVNISSESFGNNTFKGCTELKSATLDINGVTRLPDEMFNGCNTLETLEGDFKTIEIIGESAFEECNLLKKVEMPNAVIVGKAAFKNCSALKSFCSYGEIRAEDFGDSCFENCSSLTQLLNSSASTIGAKAFFNSGVTGINIEGTVGTTVVIGDSAFANCSSAKYANINLSEEFEYSLGTGIFEGCKNIESSVFTGSELPDSMFKDCVMLKTIDAPNVTIVREEALSGCNNLSELNTDEKLDTVESEAFKNCRGITETYSDMETVFTGKNIYEGCTNLTNASVGILTQGMFLNCNNLKNVQLAENITIIPAQAFFGCTALTNLDISRIANFGVQCLAGSGLKGELVIDNGTDVEEGAFQGCINLTGVTIESDTIGKKTFTGCSGLTDVTLSVNSIGNEAFSGCQSIKKVTFNNTETHQLTQIGKSAFYDCIALKSVEVPDGATVGEKALGYIKTGADKDFVIYAYVGSDAQNYAYKNKITFQRLSAYYKGQLIGDISKNGAIDLFDAIEVCKYIMGMTKFTYDQRQIADFNSSGEVDLFDAIELCREIMNSINNKK